MNNPMATVHAGLNTPSSSFPFLTEYQSQFTWKSEQPPIKEVIREPLIPTAVPVIYPTLRSIDSATQTNQKQETLIYKEIGVGDFEVFDFQPIQKKEIIPLRNEKGERIIYPSKSINGEHIVYPSLERKRVSFTPADETIEIQKPDVEEVIRKTPEPIFIKEPIQEAVETDHLGKEETELHRAFVNYGAGNEDFKTYNVKAPFHSPQSLERKQLVHQAYQNQLDKSNLVKMKRRMNHLKDYLEAKWQYEKQSLPYETEYQQSYRNYFPQKKYKVSSVQPQKLHTVKPRQEKLREDGHLHYTPIKQTFYKQPIEQKKYAWIDNVVQESKRMANDATQT